MSYRCINAFEYDGKIYPGGSQIADDHPILQTHASFFAKVNLPSVGAETATAGPGELRNPPVAEADLAAWLSAEDEYHAAVEAWLAAEQAHGSLVRSTETPAATEAPQVSPAAQKQAAPRSRPQKSTST